MLSLRSWFPRFRSQLQANRGSKYRRRWLRPRLEILEDRCLLSTTYSVNSLLDTNSGSGDAGTMRYVLNQANANHTGTAGSPDVIKFNTSGGTIAVDSADGGPLPALASNEVAIIDGTTATGYNGTPIITLDGTHAGPGANGLTISGGSSTVKGLDIINFSGNGIQLENNGNNTIVSNYIGITQSGVAAPNGENGVYIENSSGNQIGESDPVVTNQTYYNASAITGSLPVAGWQGITAGDSAGEYLITGTSNGNNTETGLLFEGTIAGQGSTYAVNYPGAVATSVYGPDNLGNGLIRLVGIYRNADASTAPVTVNGFVFQGTTSDLTQASDYTTLDIPGAQYNYVHSTAGDLAVGNYDSAAEHGSFGLPLGPGHAFLYDVKQGKFLTDIAFPGAISNTAYGIWYNGGTSYTICGGYSLDAVNNFHNQDDPIGQAYLVDYDSATGTFSHWTSFAYPFGTNYETHFEGISSTQPGVYTLSADSVQSGSTNPAQGSWVTVTRNPDGSFGTAQWTNLNYPGVDPTTHVTSSNSVYGNQVVGVVLGPNAFSYQATVNFGSKLANVISGNGGDGVKIDGAGSLDNSVVADYIGTDATGSVSVGNAGNGIEITHGARLNTIGGNTPTSPAFTGRPADGNVISANGGDGVLITNGATYNTLSGNFIGTDATGLQPLGNTFDGVAILNGSNNNSLIGTTFVQQPFVYLNLICANGGNGLRIDNSDNTTVQANSFGLADDNYTPLGNQLDGVLIEGTSTNTQFGGVIPLGNISAGNGGNGVEIADTAAGTVVFNTFAGLPAFIDKAVPNALDGMLVTSTGGNNLIRTNVVSGNTGNGIHISGNASGVQVSEVIIGMDTDGTAPLGNDGNGVLIDDNAHDNLIGGEQASVILQNTISSNGANGIAIVGNASNNQVFHSFIGTDITGVAAFGNAGAGILIGNSAQGNTIGGTGILDQNLISGNLDGGIELTGTSQGTTVIDNLIGTDRTGRVGLGNIGAGIWITSSGNQIGGTGPGMGNVIGFNTQNGVVVNSGVSDAILANSIFSNGGLGIALVSGGNNDQPAPVLIAANQLTPNSVLLTGTLTAKASTTYTLEFFDTPGGTPAGQGQNFLRSLPVTTNSSGVGSFGFSASVASLAGVTFTATATDPVNDTSQFSNAVSTTVPTPPPPPTPTPTPTPPPMPVGRLIPFAFGFGPDFQLEVVDVDAQGKVFVQDVGELLFGGGSVFVNNQVALSNVQFVNGFVVGFLHEQSNTQEFVLIFNWINAYVYNAMLTALMRPV